MADWLTRSSSKDYSYTELWSMRKELVRRLELVDKLMDEWTESQCWVCNQREMGHDSLPKDWAWVIKTGYVLCDVCLEKYQLLPTEISRGEL